MPGTGAVDAGQKWEVELEFDGPVPKAAADKFDAALNKFLKDVQKAESAGVTVKWTISRKVAQEKTTR